MCFEKDLCSTGCYRIGHKFNTVAYSQLFSYFSLWSRAQQPLEHVTRNFVAVSHSFYVYIDASLNLMLNKNFRLSIFIIRLLLKLQLYIIAAPVIADVLVLCF